MSLDSFIEKFNGFTEPYFFYNGEIELRYEPKGHVPTCKSRSAAFPRKREAIPVTRYVLADRLVPSTTEATFKYP
jgi:hypothetical protein